MFARSAQSLLAAAALAGATLSCHAATACKRPEFPPEALKQGEEGISYLAFLLRPDGTVIRSMVLNSSGWRDLDRETQTALGRCVFQVPAVATDPEGFWSPLIYKWTLTDDPDMAVPKKEAAVAARKGDLDALLRLSILLSWTGKSDADQQRSVVVLRSAAEKGHAAAQFALGRRYEMGDWVEKDLDEAMRWYNLAAKQGDVLAIQRLRLGVLGYGVTK